MKITDLALIFVAVTLPIIIIVYVNVSYTIKAEEQEIYYKQIINAAAHDAANQMKEVENIDPEIDYGYSGVQDNKVSINANIATNTFFKSLYNNLGISGNEAAEHYLQTFIPAVAIIDYNGVYISSQENYDDNGTQKVEHVLKPKKYYTYSYYIVGNNIYEGIPSGSSVDSVHTIEFTMDDSITHRGMYESLGAWKDYDVQTFFITDNKNNWQLFYHDSSVPSSKTILRDDVVAHLSDKRKEVIINTIVKEMSFAVNKANAYAKNAGISYEFSFPTTTHEEMESVIENVGVFAFVQGISLGNKYLNTKSYSVAKLENTIKYYFSIYDSSIASFSGKYKMNLYHKTQKCPEYKLAVYGDLSAATKKFNITPLYVLTKQQATSATVSNEDGKYYMGFYPCPICKP